MKEDLQLLAGVSAVYAPEYPPGPEYPAHPHRSLRPSPGNTRGPACDNIQKPTSETSRILPGVSGPTGDSGVHWPDTPAQVVGLRA